MNELRFKSSLVLMLGMLAFFVVIVDFDTDCATERDEISTVIATLNKIENTNIVVCCTAEEIPVCKNFIILQNVFINPTDVLKLRPDRAPPTV